MVAMLRRSEPCQWDRHDEEVRFDYYGRHAGEVRGWGEGVVVIFFFYPFLSLLSSFPFPVRLSSVYF